MCCGLTFPIRFLSRFANSGLARWLVCKKNSGGNRMPVPWMISAAVASRSSFIAVRICLIVRSAQFRPICTWCATWSPLYVVYVSALPSHKRRDDRTTCVSAWCRAHGIALQTNTIRIVVLDQSLIPRGRRNEKSKSKGGTRPRLGLPYRQWERLQDNAKNDRCTLDNIGALRVLHHDNV